MKEKSTNPFLLQKWCFYGINTEVRGGDNWIALDDNGDGLAAVTSQMPLFDLTQRWIYQ
jgi:hypothetical protein